MIGGPQTLLRDEGLRRAVAGGSTGALDDEARQVVVPQDESVYPGC